MTSKVGKGKTHEPEIYGASHCAVVSVIGGEESVEFSGPPLFTRLRLEPQRHPKYARRIRQCRITHTQIIVEKDFVLRDGVVSFDGPWETGGALVA